jgi:hypothetical protein
MDTMLAYTMSKHSGCDGMSTFLSLVQTCLVKMQARPDAHSRSSAAVVEHLIQRPAKGGLRLTKDPVPLYKALSSLRQDGAPNIAEYVHQMLLHQED